MKRSEIKIGIWTEKLSEEEVARKKVQKIVAVLLFLSLTACEKAWHGQDGAPGDAFLALTWQEAEPTYIDAGTGAIPPVFYWGEYYKVRPGIYNLYYEGDIWLGSGWARFAWEITYEIWVMPGERGDWYYNGANGPDNFFTIECNPYGPYVGSTYKQTLIDGQDDEPYGVEDEIVISQKKEGWEMKVTYTRVEPRNGGKIE